MCQKPKNQPVGSIVLIKNTLLFCVESKHKYFTVATKQQYLTFRKFANYLTWVGVLDERKATINCDTNTIVALWEDFILKQQESTIFKLFNNNKNIIVSPIAPDIEVSGNLKFYFSSRKLVG